MTFFLFREDSIIYRFHFHKYPQRLCTLHYNYMSKTIYSLKLFFLFFSGFTQVCHFSWRSFEFLGISWRSTRKNILWGNRECAEQRKSHRKNGNSRTIENGQRTFVSLNTLKVMLLFRIFYMCK